MQVLMKQLQLRIVFRSTLGGNSSGHNRKKEPAFWHRVNERGDLPDGVMLLVIITIMTFVLNNALPKAVSDANSATNKRLLIHDTIGNGAAATTATFIKHVPQRGEPLAVATIRDRQLYRFEPVRRIR